MRVKSYVIGIAGGAVGLLVHGALLVIFFSHGSGLFETFVRLALAAGLGLAALLVAALGRHSTRTLAALLPVFAVLGLFARPLTWAPAAVLLVASGAMAALSLRGGGRTPAAPTQAPLGPDGRPLHWSEAARLGIPLPPPPRSTSGPASSWSPRQRAGVIAGAIVAAALVIPLSLWPPSVTGGSDGQSASTHPTTTVRSTTHKPTTSTLNPGDEASTTTTAPSTTTTSKADSKYNVFTDADRGISISYPASWRNTDPRNVGSRIYGDQNRAFQRAIDDAVVSAAFADWSGPTYEGCYLDFIDLDALQDDTIDVSKLPDFRSNVQDYIDYLRQSFSDVELVEPFRNVTIGLAKGFDYTWSLVFNGQKMECLDCYLIQDDTLYALRFAAVEKDWKKYLPLYREILNSFKVEGSGTVS